MVQRNGQPIGSKHNNNNQGHQGQKKFQGLHLTRDVHVLVYYILNFALFIHVSNIPYMKSFKHHISWMKFNFI